MPLLWLREVGTTISIVSFRLLGGLLQIDEVSSVRGAVPLEEYNEDSAPETHHDIERWG